MLLAKAGPSQAIQTFVLQRKIRDETRQNNNSVQRNEMKERKKICSKNTCISIAFFVVVVVKFMTSFKHIRCCMFYNIRVCRFTFSPPRSFAVLPWLKTWRPMQRTPLDSMVIGPTPGVGPGVAPLLMPLVNPEEYPASLSLNGVVHGPSWSGPSARGAGCFAPRPLGNTKRHLAKG